METYCRVLAKLLVDNTFIHQDEADLDDIYQANLELLAGQYVVTYNSAQTVELQTQRKYLLIIIIYMEKTQKILRVVHRKITQK